jgi:hypothetical protein
MRLADGLLAALYISVLLNLALFLINIYQYRARWKPYRAAACPNCGYDVRTTIDGKCPECGQAVAGRHSPTPLLTHCSFCGKSNQQTGPHVEGPSAAYICAACVELSHNVILKNRKLPHAPLPPDTRAPAPNKAE